MPNQISGPVLDALVKAALEGADARARHTAVKILTSLRDPRTIPTLVRALGDRSEDVQFAVTKALLHFDKLAVSPLCQALLEEENVHLRRRSAWLLGFIGDPGAAPVLAQVMENAKDLRLKHEAASALKRIGNPSIPLLAEILQKSEDAIARRLAIEVLKEIGDMTSIIPLLAQALRDADAEVSAAAAKALQGYDFELIAKALQTE